VGHQRLEQSIIDLSRNVDKLYQITEKLTDTTVEEKEKRMADTADINKKIYVLLGLLIGLNILESGLLSLL